MTDIATTTHRPVGIYATDETIAAELPVSGASQIAMPWLSRLTILDPVAPGDVLAVDARARVTSELAYTVGVGHHLWCFVVGQSGGAWWRISSSNGDNVDPARHHMPLHCSATWTVPPEWPAAGRPAIVYRGDAHSTAWQPGDQITVDAGYAHLRVVRWTDTAQACEEPTT